MNQTLLQVQNLVKAYPLAKGFFQKEWLYALRGISFSLQEGEVLGVVGESGCGKSTLGRLILKIEEPTEGEIFFQEKNIKEKKGRDLKEYWQSVQMIFQNPYSSLNPRWTVGEIIGEPLKLNTRLSRKERREKVEAMMEKVGLDPSYYHRYSHQFSGGQRQRICIARALIQNPKLVVCDEPVSALDVSIQSQVLNLLLEIQQERRDLSYIFISHDLGVVSHLADQVMVMYLGKVVEMGPRDRVFQTPRHPYTQALLKAIPEVGKDLTPQSLLPGDLPSPINPPSGCAFRTRCPVAKAECAHLEVTFEREGNHIWACPFS
ncbi:MAG: dipeptide ABC transporter ATP-binding protein [Planctomycetota bacterium]|nr:MAG: dipeptide ABC transporter ATP-binding protein [Planctomycetota bacterium]